ncbi:MAG: hypothetical protein KF832_23930 [Caldilineaceae bacterium]|nr:hypothetical protein [Caldilineaceae bacterium]
MAPPQSSVSSAAKDFFEQSYAAFAQAVQMLGPTTDYSYHLADRTFRLQFSGRHLIPYVTPALAHLPPAPATEADLTISLWDGQSTGVMMPPWPATLEAYSQEQNWRFQVEEYCAVFYPAYRTISLLDQRKNQGILWTENAERFPWYESATPFINLFHWWLGDSQWQIVHAAAVGTARGGLLLVGKSGSGKSTTALRALQAGMDYVGDDYCLVRSDAMPTVATLYSSGKLLLADEESFADLHAARSPLTYAWARKAVYFFQEVFSRQVVDQLPIRAILIPTITGKAPSGLTPVSPATALRAVAPSTVFQLPGRRAEGMHSLSQLVRKVPAYRLELGTDTAMIPQLLCQLLEKTHDHATTD